MKNTIKVLLVFLILTGCATPYQKVGLSGGYSDTRLQDNVFTVNFRGNGYTSRERSSDFALLRCAELAIKNGFNFFAIEDSSQEQKTMFYKTGSTSSTYGTTNIYGNTAYSNFNTHHSGSMIVPIRKPRSSYTIFCFAEKPVENKMVFDAHYLSQSIRQKYKIKVASKKYIGTSTGKKIKSAGHAQHLADQADRVRFFLGSYCWTYRIKDVDGFATLFAHDAIENGKPFISCLPQYRRNLAKIDSIDYQIKPNRYAIHNGTGLIRMEGTFYFKARLSDSGKWQEKTGNISMDLIESGDSYLVKRLNYTSQSTKKVGKQPQWGPWKEIENKE